MLMESDLVLVHVDEKPGFYARIEEINPDPKRGWWQVHLLVLTFPLQIFTWILDEQQLDEAPFTMGGTPLRLEKLVSPLAKPSPAEEEPVSPSKNERPADAGQKVVSLAARRKK
jgi:hypothetical protein